MSIDYRPTATDEIDAAATYLNNQPPGTGNVFITRIRANAAQLELLPGLGRVYSPPNPRLPGLRVWPVQGFTPYLIYYLRTDDGIEIVRVLHGSQDTRSIIVAEE